MLAAGEGHGKGQAGGETSSPHTRTLTGVCLAHALHDGYTDLIYVLLPVWQAEFGLGYIALAVLRSLYVSALAGLQIPATALAHVLGARTVLVLGTFLSAGGYALAGASGALSASVSPSRSRVPAVARSIRWRRQ